jgi:DNA polymerase III epsilon subunit-like protein
MYLFLDTETGGLETHNSLLTVAAIVADREFRPLRGGTAEDTLYLEIRHPTYIVTPEAITINKIDLVHHSARGLKLPEAQQKFAEFLQRAHQLCGQKLIPGGHNLTFDIGFIWEQLMYEQEWKKYVTHPALDTAIVAQFFNAAGVLSCRCNLTAVCEALGIPLENAHNAMVDTKASLEVARTLSLLARPAPQESRLAEV